MNPFGSTTRFRKLSVVERLEVAGLAPDPARGDIALEVWAARQRGPTGRRGSE